jgi:hypothetical protein
MADIIVIGCGTAVLNIIKEMGGNLILFVSE